MCIFPHEIFRRRLQFTAPSAGDKKLRRFSRRKPLPTYLPTGRCAEKFLIVREHTHSSRGFTLVELLLAASIMGMISLAILSTFATGMHAFERVQSFGTRQADVLLFLEGFERDLRNTFELSQIKFEGNAQSMSFANIGTKLNDESDEEGQETTFVGKKTYYFDSVKKSFISEESNYAQSSQGTISSRQISANNVQFEYYSFKKTTDEDKNIKREYGWAGTWTDENIIPKGIKIEITYQDGDAEVTLARTVFIPCGGDFGQNDEEEGKEGTDGQGDV